MTMDQAAIKDTLVNRYHQAKEILRSVSRDDIVTAICELVDEHGSFPVSSTECEKLSQVVIGPQISREQDGHYVLKNCDFYRYEMAQQPGSAHKRYKSLRQAAESFVLSDLQESSEWRQYNMSYHLFY